MTTSAPSRGPHPRHASVKPDDSQHPCSIRTLRPLRRTRPLLAAGALRALPKPAGCPRRTIRMRTTPDQLVTQHTALVDAVESPRTVAVVGTTLRDLRPGLLAASPSIDPNQPRPTGIRFVHDPVRPRRSHHRCSIRLPIDSRRPGLGRNRHLDTGQRPRTENQNHTQEDEGCAAHSLNIPRFPPSLLHSRLCQPSQSTHWAVCAPPTPR